MKRKTNKQTVDKIHTHMKVKADINMLYMWCEDIGQLIYEQYDPESEGEEISEELYNADGWSEIHEGMADIEAVIHLANKQRRYLKHSDYIEALHVWRWIFELTWEFHGFMQDHWKQLNMCSEPLMYGMDIKLHQSNITNKIAA